MLHKPGQSMWIDNYRGTINIYGYQTIADAEAAIRDLQEYCKMQKKQHSSVPYFPYYRPLESVIQSVTTATAPNCYPKNLQFEVSTMADVIYSEKFDEIFGDYLLEIGGSDGCNRFALINYLHKVCGYLINIKYETRLATKDTLYHVIKIYNHVQNCFGYKMFDLAREEEECKELCFSKLSEYKHAVLLSDSTIGVKLYGYKTLEEAQEAADECDKLALSFETVEDCRAHEKGFFVFDMNQINTCRFTKSDYIADEVMKVYGKSRIQYLKKLYLSTPECMKEFRQYIQPKLKQTFGFVAYARYRPMNRSLLDVFKKMIDDEYLRFLSSKMN